MGGYHVMYTLPTIGCTVKDTRCRWLMAFAAQPGDLLLQISYYCGVLKDVVVNIYCVLTDLQWL